MKKEIFNFDEQEPTPIIHLDHNPDPNTLYFADRLTDEPAEAPQVDDVQPKPSPPKEAATNESSSNVFSKPKVPIVERYAKWKNRTKKVLAVGAGLLALYGGFKVVEGLMSNEEAQFNAIPEVEETRVFVYENAPLQLATIESDISLELTAGYDRKGPFGIDINPINNMYELHQEGLTTSTDATVVVGKMTVEDTKDQINVSLGGEIGLDTPAIDWSKEDMAGADITWNSYSVGNEVKDQIDNAALEIIQGSGGVAAGCALRDDKIQPQLTKGVEKFLTIVNPGLKSESKRLIVTIPDLDAQAKQRYAEQIDKFDRIIANIEKDYDKPNDIFEVDTKGITNCEEQDIKFVGSTKSD